MWDITRALELALFRTFAVPSIGALLNHTGEFQRSGQKRYDDTALLLNTLLQDGYDGPDGQRALARMNRTHAHFKISNDDYLFVLSTFVLDPIDWIDRFGWRRLTAKEQKALFIFWQQIGARMGLTSLPNSLEEMKATSWKYVESNMRFTSANEQVANSTIRIAEQWLPRILRPLVRPVTAAVLEPHARQAVGLREAPSPISWAVSATLKSRAVVMRTLRHRPKPNWPDGHRTYPNGYEIEDLAPCVLLETEHKSGTVSNSPDTADR